MNEKLLVKLKRKLKEIFTKLIRLCQKLVNKLPDSNAKVVILQQLRKAKAKLNDVDKMNVDNGSKMSQELKADADNIEATIKRTMDKLDENTLNAYKKHIEIEKQKGVKYDDRSAKAFHRKADKSYHFARKYNIDDKDRKNAVMNHVKEIDDLYA